MTTRRQKRNQGEWGIAAVISGALLGIFLLVALYFVTTNRLDEVVWERLAAGTSSQPAITRGFARTADR